MAEFQLRVPHLKTGEYTLDVAVAEGTQEHHVQHQWCFDAVVIHVYTERRVWGVMAAPCRAVRLVKHGVASARQDLGQSTIGSEGFPVAPTSATGSSHKESV